MIKSLQATACNAVCAVVIAHWLTDPTVRSSGEIDWFSVGALAEELTVVVWCAGIMSPFFSIMPPAYLLFTLPARCLLNPWTSRKTQTQVNELFLGPEFSISDHVVDVMNTFFMCFLAAPLIPFAPLFGALNICIVMVSDTFALLRVARRPHWYDGRVMKDAAQMLPYFLAPVPIVSLVLLRTPRFSPKNVSAYFLGCFTDFFMFDTNTANLMILVAVIVTLVLALQVIARFALKMLSCMVNSLCRRSQDNEGPPDEGFEITQTQFTHFYHKTNPVYAMLPEEVNPTNFDKQREHQIIGTRSGLSIVSYLGQRENVERMFTHLEEAVDDHRKKRRGIDIVETDRSSSLPSSPAACPLRGSSQNGSPIERRHEERSPVSSKSAAVPLIGEEAA